MGTYRRSGHWRRGRNGSMHWVSGHDVTRGSSSYGQSSKSSFWSSATWPSPSRPELRPVLSPPTPVRYAPLPYSSRWQKPNAQCPVCGAAVYFWSNASGSRVYFDEMGPPWPKHPCTDARLSAGPSSTNPVASYGARSAPEQSAFAAEFRQRFGLSPAQAFDVQGVGWNGVASWLYVRRVGSLRWPAVFVVPARVSLAPGHLVFVARGSLTFVDPETLQVMAYPVVTGRRAKRQYEEALRRGRGTTSSH